MIVSIRGDDRTRATYALIGHAEKISIQIWARLNWKAIKFRNKKSKYQDGC